MANERRILRLQQLILEVAAETILREARDPALELVSVTRVKLTSDLASAQVFWSCLGTERGRKRTEEALEGILPLVQRRVGDALRTRLTPRLSFRYDPTLERAQRLETIFHQLETERGEAGEHEAPEGAQGDNPPASG